MLKEFPLNNKYLISTEGEVISLQRGKPYKIKYQTDISGNYFRACLGDKHYLVHRLVAITFIPNPDDLPEVNHIDGDKHNNKASNLEWVTRQQNIQHAFDTGLNPMPKGTLNGRATLSDEDVLNIYNELLSGKQSATIARDYNLTPTTIGRIKLKKAWKHLLKDLPEMQVQKRSAKLTESNVHNVCKLICKGIGYKEAKTLLCFDVTQDQYYDIKRGRVYKHITSLYF